MSADSASRLRIKVFAVLASLIALWSFAAYVTVREGVSLAWLATLKAEVGIPVESVVAALQVERKESIVYLASTGGAARTTLNSARAATDAMTTQMNASTRAALVQVGMPDSMRARVDSLRTALSTLSAERKKIDESQTSRLDAEAYFTELIRGGFDVYHTLTVWNDQDFTFQVSTLVTLTQAQEVLSQEDVLISGVLAAGSYTAEERAHLASLVGTKRFLTKEVHDRFNDPDRALQEQVMQRQVITALERLEDRLVLLPSGTALPVDLSGWRAVAEPAIAEIRDLVLTLADRTVQRTIGPVIWIIVRLVLAVGLGLLAVAASIKFLINTARSLQRQLARLRDAALDLANVRLPYVVELLRRGDEVDITATAPPLAFGMDDIGKVGQAFNTVQETAIRATVEQAELRRGIRDLFLNLARRNQTLLHRQLKLIDAMERRAETDDELAELYRIDHLATRMRRNAENLIVLSGSLAGRGWQAPVPMINVVRGAVGEVEEYTRVMVWSLDPAALAGRAVSDVIHLIAEVIENALTFSPPNTVVSVSGQRLTNGYAIEVEDRGLGMSPEDLRKANEQIADPPELTLSSTARLGLYVVGALAQRHQIGVQLRKSPYGGTSAILLLPLSLIEGDHEPAEESTGHLGLEHSLGPMPGSETAASMTTASPSGSVPVMRDPVDGEAAPPASSSGVDIRPAGRVETAGTGTESSGPISYTPSGLPIRPPRSASSPAISAASLSSTVAVASNDHASDQAPSGYPNGRRPEDVRRLMDAYLRGANRGQSQAERIAEAKDDSSETTRPASQRQAQTEGHNA